MTNITIQAHVIALARSELPCFPQHRRSLGNNVDTQLWVYPLAFVYPSKWFNTSMWTVTPLVNTANVNVQKLWKLAAVSTLCCVNCVYFHFAHNPGWVQQDRVLLVTAVSVLLWLEGKDKTSGWSPVALMSCVACDWSSAPRGGSDCQAGEGGGVCSCDISAS